MIARVPLMHQAWWIWPGLQLPADREDRANALELLPVDR